MSAVDLLRNHPCVRLLVHRVAAAATVGCGHRVAAVATIGGLVVSHLLFMCVSLSAQDKYAFVVGVESYDTSTFINLPFATKDAIGLGEQLSALGYKTTVMTNQSSTSRLHPTSPQKIIEAIEAVLKSCANDDTLIVALSGHGVQFSDEDLLPTGVRETYFCPSDADLVNKSSLLKVSQLLNLMNGCAASRKLLLVDACQEHVLSSEGLKKGAKRIELGSVHENRRSVPGGMSVLFSCSSNQVSWAHDPLHHSVFTHFVLEYLKGNADKAYYTDGIATLSDLVAYVSKSTNDYVLGHNLSTEGQFPVLRGGSATWPIGKAKAATREQVNSIGIKLTLVPSGSFLMGSPESQPVRERDEPPHQVSISQPFFLSVTEITQGQWQAVMGSSPWHGEPFVQESKETAATYVSWNDAIEFCVRLSSREGKTYALPTEAQWEYACRARSTTAYCVGNDSVQLPQVAWSLDSLQPGQKRQRFAHEVAKKAANDFGLFDMHGNVSEWCSDWYDKDYYRKSPAMDPTGPTEGTVRVNRGGSWDSQPHQCRSAHRSGNAVDYRSEEIGFRIMCRAD